MNPMDLNKMAEREKQVAYVWNKIIFVPHHNLRRSYVAPGHKTGAPRIYHENQLMDMGAKVVLLHLWPRRYE